MRHILGISWHQDGCNVGPRPGRPPPGRRPHQRRAPHVPPGKGRPGRPRGLHRPPRRAVLRPPGRGRVWTIPKGLVGPGEDLLAAAQREFEEETGLPPAGPYVPLGSVLQANRKTVHAWAFAGDWDPARPLRANTFELEWPPGSGRIKTFPEADRGEFVNGATADRKLIPAQRAFVGRLATLLAGDLKVVRRFRRNRGRSAARAPGARTWCDRPRWRRTTAPAGGVARGPAPAVPADR